MKYPIAVRIDDVCPGMSLEKFNECISILEKYGIKPLLGIVPDCKDSNLNISYINDFWGLMLRLQNDGYPIAMHGVYHEYVSNCSGLVSFKKCSEFAGLSYDDQYKKIEYGRNLLRKHGLNTDVFFAPSHSYDLNTLRVLTALGFKYNNDGRSYMPYYLKGIKCIPSNGQYRFHFNRGILTICLHPNTASEKSMQDLDRFLGSHIEQIVTFDNLKKTECSPYVICRIEETINIAMDRIMIFCLKIMRFIKNIKIS